MEATIKENKGNWLVTVNNKNSLFTERAEAVDHAHNEGATIIIDGDIIECHHEELKMETVVVDFMNMGEADNEEVIVMRCANPLCNEIVEG